MADLYADLGNTALELLTEFGAAATLRRWSAAQYDAVSGDDAAPVPTDYATTLLFKSTRESTGGGGSIRPGSGIGGLDGHLVVEGRRDCILSNQVEPRIGDKLIVGGVEWDLLTVEEIRPSGATAVAFKCAVQK